MPCVRLRFFAAPREAVGAPAMDFDVPEGATVNDLLERLYVARPELAPWREHVLVGVNHAHVPRDTRLREGDEVAFMPPVSGGSGDAALQEGALGLDEAVAGLDRTGAGATACFLGTVRGEGGSVERLEFEAYPAMAERRLGEVREAAIRKFGLTDALIRHRVGALGVGEDIVLVAVSAPHRREAFEAAAWIMDELKTSVPIWKREVGKEGARWVNEPAGKEESA